MRATPALVAAVPLLVAGLTTPAVPRAPRAALFAAEGSAPTQPTGPRVYGTPGKGPAFKRIYPSVTLEYWLGGAALLPCTVNDVRGLQKCTKIYSCVARGDVDDRLDEALANVVENQALIPYRVLAEAETPDDVADACALAAAGQFLVGKQGRQAGAAAVSLADGTSQAARGPAPERSATKGLFNVFQKATEAVSIFGLKEQAEEMPDE